MRACMRINTVQVTNAGGIGTIGGLLLSPKALKKEIDEAKALMTEKARFATQAATQAATHAARAARVAAIAAHVARTNA